MRKQPSPAMRAELDGLELACRHAYQPEALFPNDGRKLKRCAIPTDPWRITLFRKDEVTWTDRALVGYGEGPTIDDACRVALMSVRARRCFGGLAAAIANLAVELDVLAHAMRNDVPF